MTQDEQPIYRNSRSEVIDSIAERRAQEFASESGGDQVERQLQADERPKRALERGPAATSRLHQAADALATSERELLEAEARVRAAGDGERDQAERDLKAKLNDYSEALYEGEPTRAADVMASIMADRRRAAAPVDVHAMKAAVKRELNLESTLEEFGRVYPEIVADPNLAGIADAFYAAALKEGKSQGEAFEYAGEQTRGYIKHLGAQYGMRDRGERREQGGRGERADGGESANASSIIAEMAAQRPSAMARGRGEER